MFICWFLFFIVILFDFYSVIGICFLLFVCLFPFSFAFSLRFVASLHAFVNQYHRLKDFNIITFVNKKTLVLYKLQLLVAALLTMVSIVFWLLLLLL